MLHYILQIVAFQVVSLLVYDLFLKRETFFNYNRIYLMGTAVLSFVLPFIKLETIKSVVPEDFVVVLPEVIIGKITPITKLDAQIAMQSGVVLEEPSMPLWQIIFFTGTMVSTVFFLFKILKLYRLKSNNPKRWQGDVLIVKLLKSSAAFSFFNTVFLGEKISENEQPTILKHELVHVKQWHSLDLLVCEVMRIVLWFNPLIYMYQSRIKALHEYIADDIAVKQNGKKSYYQELLNQVFETQNISFTNTFFKSSLIKKRIVMLQKSKSKQISQFKYVLLVPVILGMLIYTSVEVKAQQKEQKTESIIETIQIEEISEKALIEKYYKQMKAYEKADEFSKIMDLANLNFTEFRMTLDDYAKVKAFNKITFIEKIEDKIKKGTASDKDKEMLRKFNKNNISYEEYIQRTNTEEYGIQWESRTEDGVLKFYAKDLNNKTLAEKERLAKKIDFLTNDPYWRELIMTDGKQTNRMVNDEGLKSSSKNKDIQIKNVNEIIEVPYAVIENVPTYSECKDLATNEERKKCTSNSVAKFVNKNFNTDLADSLGLAGRQRISVGFKINELGNVVDVYARAPHPELETEAKRVISMLPKFIPGTQRGKPVTVPYGLPIIFEVKNNSNTNINTGIKKSNYSSGVKSGLAFSKVDKAPFLKECTDFKSNEARKKCTTQGVAKFVNKNFNTDLAINLGLEGRQRISVGFKIGTDGKVHSVISRAPHPKLEDEAKRVINMLPDFIPGEKGGEKVEVTYGLPIVFQVISDSKKKN